MCLHDDMLCQLFRAKPDVIVHVAFLAGGDAAELFGGWFDVRVSPSPWQLPATMLGLVHSGVCCVAGGS